MGQADELRGRIVAAYVVVREGSGLSEDELRTFMRAELAPHKCPRRFTFLPALPRTATGKLQRFRLRAEEPGATGPAPGRE